MEPKRQKQTVPAWIVKPSKGKLLEGVPLWGTQWPINPAPQSTPVPSARPPMQEPPQIVFPAVEVAKKEPATRQRARRQPASTYDGSVQVIKTNPQSRSKGSTRRGLGGQNAQPARRSSTKAAEPINPSMGEEASEITSPSPPLHKLRSPAPNQLSPASITSATSPGSLNKRFSDHTSSTARTGDGVAFAFPYGRDAWSSQLGPEFGASSESANGTAQGFQVGGSTPPLKADTPPSLREYLPGTSGDGHASPPSTETVRPSLPAASPFQFPSAPPFQSPSLSPTSPLSDNVTDSQETRQVAFNDVVLSEEIDHINYHPDIVPSSTYSELMHAFARPSHSPETHLPAAYPTRVVPPTPAPSSSPYFHANSSQVSLANHDKNKPTAAESQRPSYTASYYSHQTRTYSMQTSPGPYLGGHITGRGASYSPSMALQPHARSPYSRRNNLIPYHRQHSGYAVAPPSDPSSRYYRHASRRVSAHKPYRRLPDNDHLRADDNAMVVSAISHFPSAINVPYYEVSTSGSANSSYALSDSSPVSAAVSDEVYYHTESTTYTKRAQHPLNLAPTPPSETFYPQSRMLGLGDAFDAFASMRPSNASYRSTYIDSESSAKLWENAHIPITAQIYFPQARPASNEGFGSHLSSDSSLSSGRLLGLPSDSKSATASVYSASGAVATNTFELERRGLLDVTGVASQNDSKYRYTSSSSTPQYNQRSMSSDPLPGDILEQGAGYMLVDQVAISPSTQVVVDRYPIDMPEILGRNVGVMATSSSLARHEENTVLDQLTAGIFEDLEFPYLASAGQSLYHARYT